LRDFITVSLLWINGALKMRLEDAKKQKVINF